MLDEQQQWNTISQAFDRLEPLDAPAREQGLATLDPAIATRVRTLLEGALQRGILDREAPVGGAATAVGSIAAGETVGGFTIQRFLGRGGMGEVYLATRTQTEFDQRVALKLLRIDAVPNEALFARERRVLARLEHPSVARLIDGGVTPEGRPWMAMAYVEGVPIDRWCADHRATLAQRLKLFAEVCDAVGFAHANLIVHRDLKPANVLVDAAGRAMLLDFGIAKLIGDGNEGTLATGALMTPEYAAPEQLEDGAVTVATDIYALGLILCELLTGTTPWRGIGGSLPAIVRRILTDDSAPPSRIAGPDAPVPAGRLRGDLDAIVLKALRKTPADRYTTVAELTNDLRRFQEKRPVRARAGSRRYRLGRYLRRNGWGVAAVSAIVLAVLLGAGGIALQARRTAIERDNAIAEAKRSDAIVQTLTLMVSQSGASSDLTLKQTLDQSARRMLVTLDRSARSGAAVAALSDLYVNAQDAKGSYALLSAALAKGIGGDDPVATAQLKADLADAAVATGAKDDAPALLDQAQRALAADPARNAAALQQIVGTRAGMARRTRDYDTAIRLLTENLPAAEHAFAANDSALLTRYNNLLVYLIEANRLDEAGPVFDRANRVLAQPGQRDTIQALGLDQLRGAWQLRRNHPAAAEQIAASVVERRRRLFGETPGLANDLGQLAKAQLAEGKFIAARTALYEARPLALKYLGPQALPVVGIDLTLVQVLAELGDTAAAEAQLAQDRTVLATLPSPNPLTPQLALTEAILAVKQGKQADAAAAAARARAGFGAIGPAGAYGLQAVAKVTTRIAAMP